MESSRPIKAAIRKKYPAIRGDDTLQTAMKSMAAHDVSALVVMAENEVTGIITIADVIYCLVTGRDCQRTPVSAFMTACNVITQSPSSQPCAQLDEDQDLISALKVMHEAGSNHLLISGVDGKAVGLVSSLEIVKLLAADS